MRATALLGLTVLLAVGGCHRHKHDAEGPPVPVGPAVPEQLVIAGGGQSLTRVTSDPTDEYRPNLSPDGSSLLLVATTREVVNGAFTGRTLQQIIVGTNPQNGASRTIYTSANSQSGSPAWLPDGKAFLFMSNAMGQWNLVRTLSKAPNSAVTIVDRGDVAQGLDKPSPSPDGKRVAFQMKVGDQDYVGVSGIDGSSFTQLGPGSWPSWSPDGKTLAFTRSINNVNQLFLVNPDTGENLVQVTNDQEANTNPCWSPDGKWIVFQSNRGWNKFPSGRADLTWNLFAVKPDGTGITQLTDGARDTGQPYWGKDGWIYFVSNESGNYDVWRLKPSGELASTTAM